MIFSSSSLRPRRLQAAESFHPEAGLREVGAGGGGAVAVGRRVSLGRGGRGGPVSFEGVWFLSSFPATPPRPSSASPKTSCIGGPADLDSFYDHLQGDLRPVPSHPQAQFSFLRIEGGRKAFILRISRLGADSQRLRPRCSFPAAGAGLRAATRESTAASLQGF